MLSLDPWYDEIEPRSQQECNDSHCLRDCLSNELERKKNLLLRLVYHTHWVILQFCINWAFLEMMQLVGHIHRLWLISNHTESYVFTCLRWMSVKRFQLWLCMWAIRRHVDCAEMVKPNMALFTDVWRCSHVSGLFLCILCCK